MFRRVYPTLANVSDGELSLYTSLCLDGVTCAIVLLVHGGACCVVAFRRGKKAKTHTKQTPIKKWHCMFRTGRVVDVLEFFGRSGRTTLVDCCRLPLFKEKSDHT